MIAPTAVAASLPAEKKFDQRQTLVDQKADRHRIDHGDSGGLGRRHDSAIDAAKDDHRHQQRRKGMKTALGDLA